MKGSYLVAGATGAIGRALARSIKAQGGVPLLAGRNPALLEPLAAELDTDFRVVDFSQVGEVGPALKDMPGDLQGFAYAVGSITLKPLRAASPEDFLTSFTLNTVGAAESVKAVAPQLRQNRGSVVLFSTVAVQSGFTNHSVISASKGAVEGLTRSLAAELAPAVRVNCIAPSLTHTSAMGAALTANEKTAKGIAATHPLQRLGAPEDSAEMAAFLLSQKATWITGQILHVDGGKSSLR